MNPGGLNMRVHPVVLTLALSIGGIAAQTPVFAQESQGTLEQRMACTPDVLRLCSDQIPDTNRIVACLQQNTELLSGGCRAVFESNNSVPPPPQPLAPRRRNDPIRLYQAQ
jgi:hypothetical protein